MSAEDVARLITDAEISNSEIRRAAVHLPKPLRAALFSETAAEHRTAEGMFFEALVYEILLAEGDADPQIARIAAKLNDAEYVSYDRFAKDGLWYTKNGEIQFRVRGKAAAEVDFLVLCADDILVFGEISLKPDVSPGFEKEVLSKKELLRRFLDDAGLSYGVEFVFVTPVSVASESYEGAFPRLADAVCVVEDGNMLWKRVHVNEVLHKKRSPAPSAKRVGGREIFRG
ncbi:MAG: hypothetical protein Q4Q20_05810 [Methanocorpusculum sp.]|nr:hypothetical protein [Methanocorpusculum sp.]